MNARTARIAIPILVALTVVIAACASGNRSSPGAGSQSPGAGSPPPSPTPITVDVSTPEAAAALVLAVDPRFAGTIKLTLDLIGASRWWEAEPRDGGGFRIIVTVGWGDCPAGCIERHTWTYDVSAFGDVTFVGEAGAPIPPEGIPAG